MIESKQAEKAKLKALINDFKLKIKRMNDAKIISQKSAEKFD